jgi:hypothetical protein
MVCKVDTREYYDDESIDRSEYTIVDFIEDKLIAAGFDPCIGHESASMGHCWLHIRIFRQP